MADGTKYKGRMIVTGEVEGTGSAIYVSLDFKPQKVVVYNIDGNAKLEWCAGMADDKGVKTVDSGAGTTDVSYIASGGITPGTSGFSIGADTDINVGGCSSETMIFEAYRY